MRFLFRILALCCVLWLRLPAAGQGTPGAPPPSPDRPATFTLPEAPDAMLTLHGTARFHAGDDPRWAAPGLDDREWQLVRADTTWDELGFRDLGGLAWYRFTVQLPHANKPYALTLPPINTAYQVFVEGKLVRTVGDMPPSPSRFLNVYELVPLPVTGAAAPVSRQIALRVWEAPEWTQYRPGGFTVPATLGSLAQQTQLLRLQRLKVRWSYFDWTFLFLLEVLGVPVAAALYASRRSHREYLWFALLLFGLAANHLVRTWFAFAVYPIVPVEAAAALGTAIYLAASLLFYRSLLGVWRPLLFRGCAVLVALWLLNAWLSGVPGYPITWENIAELALLAPVSLWIICLVAVRAWARVPDARLLVLPVTLMLLSASVEQLAWTLETTGHPGPHLLWYRISHIGDVFFTPQDIAETVFLLAMLAILVSRFARTQREQDRTTTELEAARSVQQVLVPEELPPTPGLAIHAVYHPAQEVGGDFFQVLPLPSGAVLVAVGDVAGKGMPAALTVSLVVGTLRTLADYTESPGAILAGLNRRLHGRGSGFTTCLVLRFEPGRTACTMANAGHVPPYRNGVETGVAPCLPLGLALDASFAETTVPLQAGDHLALLTDGVPEAMHHRELFGFARTAALTAGSATAIADAACRFGQTDDITVLTIDVLPGAAARLAGMAHLSATA